MTDERASQGAAAPVFRESFCAPAARPYVLMAAILASALGFIDSFVVSIALPAMRLSLDASLVQGQWFHNAYMLTLAALILVGGALGDRIGLARAFGAGIALFVVASCACALAPTPAVMILARTIQGIGAAVMVPGSLAIIARAYPAEERGRAIGIWAAASALTTALGPILGGLLLTFGTENTWRIIFAINLPLGALALWMLWAKVGRDTAGGAARIDLPGATLATAGLLAMAWGLTQLGHEDGNCTVWIALGVATLALFLWAQARSSHPMMPLTLFESPAFSAANAMSFTLYAALGMVFFFMPMTFIAGWGYSEIEASAPFAPMSIFIALLSSRAGRLADKIGPAPLLIVGSLLTGLGYFAMGWLAPAQDLWRHIVPAMCVVGIGMALVVAPLSTVVMGAVSEAQSGIASGVNNAISRMAGLISVAATGGLVSLLYTSNGGIASFGIPSDAPGHSEAMNAAFAGVVYVAAGLSALTAIIGMLFLRK
ncbi:MFS transporter [Sulfitobacter sp. TSTF-M16]|uniref:MFS transporter n=1 Tax=Sulfitobacter aestuariivivens TaxID=2766981 RepID=A0A927D2Z6_9RHOB|nr:MFS transporter [Sulfitobacter aestuariivivens]MBD3662954.1 MFS transporter [Sulfitobacter aestuariivivens]